MHLADLKNCIEALSHLTGVQLRVLDAQGYALTCSGAECEACDYFRRYFSTPDECRELGRRACARARDIAETYVFSCPLGLCNAVRAIEEQDGAVAVMAGPFLLEELDTLFIQELVSRYQVPLSDVLEVYEKAQSIRVLAPADANALSRLLNYLFASESENDAVQRKMVMQQRRIGESIQAYKGFSGTIPAYPFEKEQALVRCVETGNVQDANRILNELLGYALFSTGSELETVKGWAAELCALLSRAANQNGKADSFRMDHSFMRSLWETQTLERLALLLQEIVERFCQSVFPTAVKGEKTAVSRTIRYVELHYAEHITLDMVAGNVYLSPSYLSSLFKKVLGFSFNEYLNTVRITEAKHRLSRGWDSVTEIAYAVGYESQSYFSKVFKRMTGMSPSEYQRAQQQSRREDAQKT